MTPSFVHGDPPWLDDRFPLPLDRPFTTAEALGAGVSERWLTKLVATGLLRRPVKGVYLAAQLTDSPELRSRVLAIGAPPGTVVTDWSATWFWTGLDRPGSHVDAPLLSVFRFRGHERLRNGMVSSGERWLLPSDVVPLDGNVCVTTPIRTAWDLGRFSPPIVALGGMDALARLGSFTVPQLIEDAERFHRQRGVVQLRRLVVMVDPRAESPGESGLRFRWLEVPGMPAPDLQIPVVDERGTQLFRIDLGVAELCFGAEYDGERWHSSPESRHHDEWRRNLLSNEHGWGIEVFRREHVFGQHEEATSRLPAALAAARARVSRRTG